MNKLFLPYNVFLEGIGVALATLATPGYAPVYFFPYQFPVTVNQAMWFLSE